MHLAFADIISHTCKHFNSEVAASRSEVWAIAQVKYCAIGANIREAQYAHGKADFIAKLQIALKEANETGYWLELLYKTNYISEGEYKSLDSACTSMRVMLIASINTAKENAK